MSQWYTNYLPHLVGFIAILLLSVPSLILKKWTGKFDLHQHIQVDDVQRVLYCERTDSLAQACCTLSGQTSDAIILRFNEATFLQKRTHYRRPEALKHIRVELKNGETIEISSAKEYIDILRKKPAKAEIFYWAKGDFQTFIHTIPLDEIELKV